MWYFINEGREPIFGVNALVLLDGQALGSDGGPELIDVGDVLVCLGLKVAHVIMELGEASLQVGGWPAFRFQRHRRRSSPDP